MRTENNRNKSERYSSSLLIILMYYELTNLRYFTTIIYAVSYTILAYVQLIPILHLHPSSSVSAFLSHESYRSL